MITCSFCKFCDPHATPGFKTELRFISVIDATGLSDREHKRFLCGVECYVMDTLRRDYSCDEEDFDPVEFEEFKNKNERAVRNQILAFPAIQNFLERNGLPKQLPEKEFDVQEEIKDWADC